MGIKLAPDPVFKSFKGGKHWHVVVQAYEEATPDGRLSFSTTIDYIIDADVVEKAQREAREGSKVNLESIAIRYARSQVEAKHYMMSAAIQHYDGACASIEL